MQGTAYVGDSGTSPYEGMVFFAPVPHGRYPTTPADSARFDEVQCGHCVAVHPKPRLSFACLHVFVYAHKQLNVLGSKHATMKTVAIISQKGGAGKTTVAIHLAVAAEQHGVRTTVFDLDPQVSATSWADRRKTPTPAVVAAQPPRLAHLLAQAAAQSADLVLIDSAPNADAASLAAARVADLILIPCRPAAFDLDAIGTTLNPAAVAGKPAWVMLNAVSPHGKLGEEAAEALRQGGVQVAPLTLHHLVAFAHAVNDGRTAQEYEPRSRAATEVGTLFKWLTKTLPLQTHKRANVKTRKRANI
jgi:chromosome partitioning protein